MLPFTRNVFDPMDFTPMVLDRIDNIEQRTSSAFELALSVMFTSGIQHYAEIPRGMARSPGYVREFLREVPSVWDDIEFLDGFPGRYVVIARRSRERWFVAGINAEKQPRNVVLNLGELHASAGTLITDGDGGNLSFRREALQIKNGGSVAISMKARGGFVAVVE